MGKRKKLFSSILSFVLVIALTANNLVFAAADPSVKAEKTANWTSGNEGEIAEVKLRVTAQNKELVSNNKRKTDVVLVIDNSASMNDDNKLKSAKNAATLFVSQLLTEDNNGYVNIALVKYNNSVGKLDFTSEVDKLNGFINGMQATEGTNIQAGLKTARELLEGRQTENKIIVLLSDGEPTYSYRGTAMDTKKTDLNENKKSLKLITQFNYNKLKGNGTNYLLGQIFLGGEIDRPYDIKKGNKIIGSVVNHGDPTISESFLAKQVASIYTIRYGTDNDNSKYVMNNVASELSKAYNAISSKESIDKVFNTIGTEVKTIIGAGTDAYVEDVIPNYFTFMKDGVAFTGEYMDQGKKVTVTENKDTSGNRISTTVRWEIGELAKGTTGVTVQELLYNVRFDKQAYLTGLTKEQKEGYSGKDAEIYTNLSADLYYMINTAGSNETPKMEKQHQTMENPFVTLKLGKYTITYDYEGNATEVPGYKVDGNINSVTDYAFDGDKVQVALGINDDDKEKYQSPIITPGLDTENMFTVVAGEENEVNVTYLLKRFNVTFLDADGKAFPNSESVQEVKWGDDAVEPTDKPTKTGNDEFRYEFIQWTSNAKNVIKDEFVNPEFSNVRNKYTITYLDRDENTVIKSNTVDYGSVVSVPLNPGKPSDSETGHDYKFTGWKVLVGKADAKPGDAVTGDVTFVATYEDTLQKRTVTYMIRNKSGLYTKLKDVEVEYGKAVDTLPELSEEQIQLDTLLGHFNFNGEWKGLDGSLFNTSYEVKYNICVLAQYDSMVLVNFRNYDGAYLDTVRVKWGSQNIKYTKENPAREGDLDYYYEFAGWVYDKEAGSENAVDEVAGPVKKDCTVYASYHLIQRKITVSFYDVDPLTGESNGTLIYTTEINNRGSVENPVVQVASGSGIYVRKDNSEQVFFPQILVDEDGIEKEYSFEQWDKSLDDITLLPGTDNYVVLAVYDAADLYTVTFVNYDGKELKTVKVAEGKDAQDPRLSSDFNVPERPSEQPRIYNWKFNGWDDPSKLKNVTSNQIINAVYEQEPVNYRVVFLDWKGSEYPGTRIEDAHFGDTITKIPNLPQSIVEDGVTYRLSGEPWVNTDKSEGALPAAEEFKSLTGHLTVRANYEKVVYKVYFMNWDKEEQLGMVVYDKPTVGVEVPESAKNPTRAMDSKFTYEFKQYVDESGKPVDLTTLEVNSDCYLYASYTEKAREYTINYYEVTYDELTKQFTPKDKPVFTATTTFGVNPQPPKKVDDFKTTLYEFTANEWDTPNWNNLGINEIEININASYDRTDRKYQIRFYDATMENGNSEDVLYAHSLSYGSLASDTSARAEAERSAVAKSKMSEGMYTYAFDRWVDAEGNTVDFNKEKPLIHNDSAFYARYTRVLRQYTITYMEENSVEGATPFAKVVADFGSNFQEDGNLAAARKTAEEKANETAKKKNSVEKTYAFGGWMMLDENNHLISADENLTGIVRRNLTLYASYKEITNKFTITYMAKEFNSKSNYVFGVVDTVNGGTEYILRTTGPSKASDSYRYTFDSWMIVNEAGEEISSENGKISSVEGNLTLYPEYTKNIIKRDKTVIEEWNPWERIPERNNPEPAAPVETEGGGEVTTTPEDTTPSESIPVDEIEIPEDDIPQGTPEEQADTAEQENNQGEERASDEMEAEDDSKPKSAPVLPKTGTVSDVLLYLIGFTLVLAGSVVVVEYRFKRKAE